MQRLYEAAAYDTKAPIGSWWQESGVSLLSFAAASGEVVTDVAIIGGGYTGLNAALQLAEKHGREVTLLEAAQPGWGASGRNGGFACLGGSGLSTSTQIRRFGMAETRDYMARQVAAIDRVRDNLTRYGIEADTHSDGELMLAHRPDVYGTIIKDAAFEKKNFGIGFEAIPKAEQAARGVDGPGFHGGVIRKAGFALNPLKYVQGLAQAADRTGVRIFGNSPVLQLAKDGTGFLLTTPNARIRAKNLIIATNGYSSDDIPVPLGGRFLPLLSAILVTRPISADEQAAQGWSSDLMSYDSRHLLHYFRLLPDGRFLFGQRGAVRATAAGTKAAEAANRRDFERMFPGWKSIPSTHHWSGLLCLTRNLHQFTGPLEGLPGAYASLGYHGNGVAMGSLGGRLLGDMVAGKSVDLPRIMRTPLKRFPLPALRRAALRVAYLKYQVQDRFF